jgi:phosphatidate cytidylyltransferase
LNNTLQRLLLFFLAIPALVCIILFLPFLHHLAITLVIILFTAGSSYEIAGILIAKGLPASKVLSAVTGTLIPLAFWASTWFQHAELPGRSIGLGTAFILIFLLSPFAFAKTESIGRLLPEILGVVFAILYPGLLAGYIILIASALPQASEAILVFALITLGNDSLAWFFGMTLGKRRNIIAVSPNKSWEGFIGGLLASVGVAFLGAAVFPNALPFQPYLLLGIGLIVGAASIVGDLFESALKRSAGVKDSGRTIPGRGGFLDSIDSLLFAAPVFYGFCVLFNLFA